MMLAVAALAVVASLLAVAVVAAISQRPGPSTVDTSPLRGSFVKWEPVDEGHGFATVSVTNEGSSAVVPHCTVLVSSDLGAYGFAVLTGDPVPPRATITRRLAINVGTSSFRVKGGTVTNC
jgi:hypothetical protein